MKRGVILCEGYDDRSFLSEWLKKLGIQSLEGSEARQVEIWGNKLPKKSFLFQSSNAPLLIQPCGSGREVGKAVLSTLRERTTTNLDSLIVCVDDDSDASSQKRKRA